MPDDPRVSNWQLATEPDLEFLRLVIQLVMEFYDATGRVITATELQVALRHPGL